MHEITPVLTLLSLVDGHIQKIINNDVRGFISGVGSTMFGKGAEGSLDKSYREIRERITAGGFFVNEGTNPVKFDKLDDSAMLGQLVALRTNLRQQICSVFGIPPSYLGLPSAQGGDLSLVFNQFILNCVSPVARAIENGLNVSLLSAKQRRSGTSFHFDLDQALIAKIQDRVTTAIAMVSGGIADINEARELVGLSPRDEPACKEILYDKTNRDTVKNISQQNAKIPILNGNGNGNQNGN